MPPEELYVRAGGILDGPIRVMHRVRWRLTGGDGLVQRPEGQAGGQRPLERPAHHLARGPVQEDPQVDELGAQAKARDIGPQS